MTSASSRDATLRDFAACDFIQIFAWATHFNAPLAAEWACTEAITCLVHAGWTGDAASELVVNRMTGLRRAFYQPLDARFAGAHALYYWDLVATSVRAWDESVWKNIREEIVEFNAQF